MSIDNSFKDYILDQLIGLDNIWSKRMFGGFGLYAGETFFGIMSDDVLYLKTNKQTKKGFVDAGMNPFRPSSKQTLKNYFEVPEEIVDNREELVIWANESIKISAK